MQTRISETHTHANARTLIEADREAALHGERDGAAAAASNES